MFIDSDTKINISNKDPHTYTIPGRSRGQCTEKQPKQFLLSGVAWVSVTRGYKFNPVVSKI